MPITSFPYVPLKGSEIRYITLHAFDGSIGQVQCTLHQAPLENLDFTALSYAWGDPDVTKIICLLGMPFYVTTNLEACLRQFATNPKMHELNLWVDAICINQGDIDERNAQVWRMKDIYSAAVSVKAWIGIDSPQTRVGMQRLRDLPTDFMHGSDPLLSKLDPAITKPVITKALEGDGAEGIAAVFMSSYWQRAWVLQELFLGKAVVMVCGRDEVSLQQFLTWRALACKHSEATADPWPLKTPIKYGPAIIALCKGKSSLPRLLGQVKSLLCSDPRDRIYCLLGMVESWEAEAIVPNYSRPALKVCGDVVQSQIKKYDNLEVLFYGRYDEDRDPSYPSWIPDWRSESAATVRTFFGGQVVGGAYHASKGLSLSSHPWQLDRDNEKLHLSGTKLDTITAVSQTQRIPEVSDQDFELDLAKAWFKWGYKALSPESLVTASGGDRLTDPEVPRYPLSGDEPLSQACRRTLVGDFSLSLFVRKGQVRRGYQFLFPGEEDKRWPDGLTHSHLDTAHDFTFERGYKRMVATSKGWIGLVAEEAEVGDQVAVVIGASMPLILRAAPENALADRDEGLPDEYRLVGHGYIHGLMDGEGLDMGEIGEIVIR